MNRRNKIIVLSVCILLCFAVAGGTFAWYKRAEAKRARTDTANVMAPYNLYLLNPDAADSLQFAVGNLHPGEEKQTVICVSNKRPQNSDEDDRAEMAEGSEFGYDLMLVHTDNLAVNYNIYPLERYEQSGGSVPADGIIMDDGTKDKYYWKKKGDALSGEDKTDEMRSQVGTDKAGIVNAGTYWISADDSMQLTYKASENKYQYDYYLIEITWKDDVYDFSAYKKETDLVYVVVNAKQPRPVEK